MSLPAEPHETKREPTELAVILAAGEGSRLAAYHSGIAKPMVPLLGMSLVERVVVACMTAGIRQFVIVLGHREEQIRDHLQEVSLRRGCQVDFVIAKDWKLGNGTSALAACAKVGDAPCLLVMSDHLIAPSLVKAVLQTALGPGEICLAIDRNKTGIFDLPDVTKVQTRDGKVHRLGKSIEPWDAADTGVFRCTAALFDSLGRCAAHDQHSLTDGVNALAAAGSVTAVDVTGQDWLDVDTPQAYREAKRRLLKSLAKPGEDGYISTYINRPISTRLSAWLVTTPVSPNQITLFSFVVCLLGAWSFAVGGYAAGILGAILVQFASIVDGCDGEVARLKHIGSPRGAWLDTVLDRYGDLAVAFAVTLAYAANHPGPVVWAGGFMASAGFILTSYVTKEFFLRHGYPYPNNMLTGLRKRDLRLFVICLGAVCGQPFAALVAMGALSHVVVFATIVTGWFGSSGSGDLAARDG